MLIQPSSSWGELIEAAKVNLASAWARPALSLVVIVGFAAVVIVTVSVLSIARGITQTLDAKAADDIAIIYSAAANAEMGGTLSDAMVDAIAAHPGIARADGHPLVSPTVLGSFAVPRRGSVIDSNVVIRGVEPRAFEVYPQIEIVAGRRFQSGLSEVMVGEQATRQFQRLALGERFRAGDLEWTVVGIFRHGGGVAESEVWTDADMLQSAFRVGNVFSSVHVKLERPGAVAALEQSLQSDPRLNVKVEGQRAYQRRLGRWLVTLVSTAGVGLGILMGIAAVVGAINIMNTIVAGRQRELAMLRALGFRRSSVLCGVLAEGIVLGAVAGVVGGAIAYLAFNGYQTSTVSPAGFTQTAFTFAVTPDLILTAIGAALAMGALGALMPAIKASRIPVARVLAGDQ